MLTGHGVGRQPEMLKKHERPPQSLKRRLASFHNGRGQCFFNMGQEVLDAFPEGPDFHNA
jgi:hypothetical protein